MSEQFKIFEKEGLGSLTATVGKDGETLFSLKDVCECLGIKNHRDVAAALASYDKENVTSRPCVVLADARVQTGTNRDGVPVFRAGKESYITEAGLYLAVLRSEKPAARRFVVWLAEEVLPTLRKHGVYAVGEEDWEEDERESFHEDVRPLYERHSKGNAVSEFFNGRAWVAPDGKVFHDRNECRDYVREFWL